MSKKIKEKKFTDRQILDWAKRHDLYMSIGSINDMRCAFEDAASMQPVLVVKEKSPK